MATPRQPQPAIKGATPPRSVNPPAFICSPAHNGFYIGPLFFHAYGIMYVLAVAAAIYVTRRRWKAFGGDPDLVYDVAKWGFPAGLIGGRIYFLITTPAKVPAHWWGPFAIWDGGLGIWRRDRRRRRRRTVGAYRRIPREQIPVFMDCTARAAPARRPGDQPGRQLFQPGAVRQADVGAVGAADRTAVSPTPGLSSTRPSRPPRLILGSTALT